MNRTTPRPADTVTILAADILATRASELLEQLAAGSWPAACKLRDALTTYSEVRLGDLIEQMPDPEPAPVTQKSVRL